MTLAELDPQTLKNIIPRLPKEKQAVVLQLTEELKKRKQKEKAQDKFLEFVGSMWENFIHGRHHEIMAEAFERVATG